MPVLEVTVDNCEKNVTAQTGLTASMFCCLGIVNKDLGVRILIFNQNLEYFDSDLVGSEGRK